MKRLEITKDSSLGTWERPVPFYLPIEILNLRRLSIRLSNLGERANWTDICRKTVRMEVMKFALNSLLLIFLIGVLVHVSTFHLLTFIFVGLVSAIFVGFVIEFKGQLRYYRSQMRPTNFL